MKGIIITIIMFAIVIAILVAVIIPIINKGKDTGQAAHTDQKGVDTNIGTLKQPVNFNLPLNELIKLRMPNS